MADLEGNASDGMAMGEDAEHHGHMPAAGAGAADGDGSATGGSDEKKDHKHAEDDTDAVRSLLFLSVPSALSPICHLACPPTL